MTHLKHLKLLLLIFGGLLLALPQISHAKKLKWKNVSEDALEIIFRGEQLSLKLKYSVRKKAGSGLTQSMLVYGNQSDRYAALIHVAASPGQIFRPIEKFLDKNSIKNTFSISKNNEVTWGTSEPLTTFGREKIHFLTINYKGFNKRRCIAWARAYSLGEAHTSASEENRFMQALYCQTETISLPFAKKVVKLSGHKGGYIPPKLSTGIVSDSNKPKSINTTNAKTIPNDITFDEGDEYKRGLAAYQKGDYKTALQIFEPLGEQGNASAKIYLGLIKGLPKEIATKQKSPTNDWQSVPLAASWESKENLLAGVLKYKNNGGKGSIEASAGNISCKGTWQFVSGKYGTNNLPIGTWAIACNDGSAASGTYKSNKLGKGTGRGTDADGNTVKLTFGLN